MPSIGDIVLCGENICTIIGENPIILATNEGTTRKDVKADDLDVIVPYNEVLAAFTRNLLCI